MDLEKAGPGAGKSVPECASMWGDWSQGVVSGTEARLGHGKSGILGRTTTEHAGMALSPQGRVQGWEVQERLIRIPLSATLTPLSSQRSGKEISFSILLTPKLI